MPPVTIDPLNVGTVPEVYTMPLDVHAPLAAEMSEFTILYSRQRRTENGALSAQIGDHRLLSSFRCWLSDCHTGNNQKGGKNRGDGNHCYVEDE